MACNLTILMMVAGGPVLAQHRTQVASTAPPVPLAIPPAPTAGYDHQADKKKLEEQTADEKDKDNHQRYVRLPALSDVFAVPNDERLQEVILERLRQDERDAGKDPYSKYPKGLSFPKVPLVGGGLPFVAKTSTYPPARITYEPLYVVHRRLHFEEKNAERYGWDLGIMQPFISAAYFYKDVLLWPNSLASGVAYGFWSTNAGKCLPGSATPYMLYPPGLTITGSVVEGLFITGVAFAIP